MACGDETTEILPKITIIISLAISGTDLLEVPIPYLRPIYIYIYKAYVFGNIPTKYGQKYDTVLVPPF